LIQPYSHEVYNALPKVLSRDRPDCHDPWQAFGDRRWPCPGWRPSLGQGTIVATRSHGGTRAGWWATGGAIDRGLSRL